MGRPPPARRAGGDPAHGAVCGKSTAVAYYCDGRTKKTQRPGKTLAFAEAPRDRLALPETLTRESTMMKLVLWWDAEHEM